MKPSPSLRSAFAACLALAAHHLSAETVWVDTLDLKTAIQDYGTATARTSLDGHALTIAGRTFERGFATHAEGWLAIRLDGKARSFSAQVGMDDEVKGKPGGTAEFVVLGDEVKLWSSGLMRVGDAPKPCEVSLAGVKRLELVVTDGEDHNYYDHANWADAKIEADGAATFATIARTVGDPYILTPPPPATPRINGASVFGVRPGSPFLFTVPATGDRPMKFSATGLPAGLEIDAHSGRITGRLAAAGTHVVTLRAENALGHAEKPFRIVCGDRIALTPPMGWNSWNCFAQEVTADRVKRAADTMVKTGLINHGWTYINVDDFWQHHREPKDPTLAGPTRDAHGNIVPNVRFGDMKALADYVHALGLKVGLYSSPGPWTCGGCAGSYGHEAQDAQAYAAWEFDYLKYDWCSYGGIADGLAADDPKIPSVHWGKGETDLAIAQAPYALMGEALQRQPRDIVYSLCQYGMSDVWKWGDTVGGNCWRTTNDISGTWKSMSGIALAQDKAAPFAKPGNWNDPDMLILGHIGWGNPQPTRLTPDEQYLHFSLWCLFSAPLLIGCDMEKLDAFTLNLLTNDEVIAIDQDPLGQQATCVDTVGDVRVYLKKLEDGSVAVGFCNFGRQPAELKYAGFAKLGLAGCLRVRDLWRQQDVGTVEAAGGVWPLTIPTHGVVLLRLSAEPSAAAAASPAPAPGHWRNAPTPPLGWNSWDYFGTTITEAQAREQADAMAAALKPAGYDLFTVDIQWYEPEAAGHDYKDGAPLEMDAYSRLLPAVKKFPSSAHGAGFKPLADYVHAKGLRFGIHLMRGIARQAVRNNTAILGTTARAADIADTSSTCAWNPDMYGVDLRKPGAQEYYDSLFALYAAWGVDFVKVDDIARPYDAGQQREIEAIRRAIDKTGRPIALSLSPGDTPLERGDHVMRHANLWRISDDFWDRWAPLHGMFGRLDKWTRYRAEGAWPDADMLPFGLLEFGRPTRFTQDEQTTCMTLWCIARSPLIFGGDLTRLDPFTRQLLTNPEVLAVNQHSANNRQLSRRDDLVVWVADVPGSRDRYVALFNAQDNSFPYDFAKAAYRSPVLRGTETVDLAVPLAGTRKLALVVTDGGDNMYWDHADWLEPVLTGPAGTLDLAARSWNYARSGNGEVRPGLAMSGKPLQIDGHPVPGFGAHAPSIIEFTVPAGYDTFRARARLSPTRPEGKGGSVEFLVLTDTAADARPETATVRVALSELGLTGGAVVRDLWKRSDLGTVQGEITAELPLHGAALYRVSPLR